MKSILEFKLPDEKHDLLCAIHGTQLYLTLIEIRNEIRNVKKYDKDPQEALDAISEGVIDALNISLDE